MVLFLFPGTGKASQIDGTEWEVELIPSSGEGKRLSDTLTFEGGKITSNRLSQKGFPSSNFTLTKREGEDVVIWETMQTSEEEGLSFWRGEIRDTAMRGVFSQHPIGGDAKDFSFIGKRTKAAEVTEMPNPPPVQRPPVAQVSEPGRVKEPVPPVVKEQVPVVAQPKKTPQPQAPKEEPKKKHWWKW